MGWKQVDFPSALHSASHMALCGVWWSELPSTLPPRGNHQWRTALPGLHSADSRPCQANSSDVTPLPTWQWPLLSPHPPWMCCNAVCRIVCFSGGQPVSLRSGRTSAAVVCAAGHGSTSTNPQLPSSICIDHLLVFSTLWLQPWWTARCHTAAYSIAQHCPSLSA
jgi:hypothetical protein